MSGHRAALFVLFIAAMTWLWYPYLTQTNTKPKTPNRYYCQARLHSDTVATSVL